MEIGIKGTRTMRVEEGNTAKAVGSGTLDVLATPAMVTLIEETAWRSVASYLPEGQATVGTLLQVEHLSPTPIGMQVVCRTELVAIEGRRLTFKVEVVDDAGPVGRGTHERFIIDAERFMKKAASKGV